MQTNSFLLERLNKYGEQKNYFFSGPPCMQYIHINVSNCALMTDEVLRFLAAMFPQTDKYGAHADNLIFV